MRRQKAIYGGQRLRNMKRFIKISLFFAMLMMMSISNISAHAEDKNNFTVDSPDDAIVLFSLPDRYFDLPLTEIPYYSNGVIEFKEEYIFSQFNEGHQPWLSNAVDVVTVMCSNLIGQEISNNYSNVEIHTANQLKTKDGVDISITDKTGGTTEVELTVPGKGKYDISLESPEGTAILYIREILFHPDRQVR